MSRFSPSLRWALVVLSAGEVGCSRADVYPITRDPADDGNSGGTGNAAGMGGGTAGNGRSGDGGEPFGCPSPVLPPGDSERTVLVDSMERSYVLHVPPAYDGSSPVPLVLDFHGLGESGSSERASSPYPALLDAEGVVMAFPDGLRGPAGSAWNVGPCCVADVDDVAFSRAVVASVQELACIDPRRVYAVGVLTGGGLVHYLGCHAADLFAAVSPAAFDLLEENVDGCAPARPISVVSFRGTAPSRVPYEGGSSSLVPGMPLTFLGARETFDTWAELNRCTGAESGPDENGCAARSGCAEDTEVILCTDEGGREEPGDPCVAWYLLRRHTL